MSIIQSETRAGIRQAIGDHLGCITIGTASSASDTVTLKDTVNLFGGDDEYIGSWIYITDATDNTINVRRITDFTASTSTLTFSPALSFNVASGDSYELWHPEFNPDRVNRIINDCISEVSDRILVPDEDKSLYGDLNQQTYTIPSNISMISKIQYRQYVDDEELNDASAIKWEAGTSDPALTTVSTDTVQYREGSNSLNLLNASSSIADGTVLAYSNSTSAQDISDMDKIEFWVKSSVALSSGSLELELWENSATTAPSVAGTKRETLSLPALAARTWTRVELALANPELDTSIQALQFVSNHASELDSAELWVNNIKAYRTETEHYETLDNYYYKVNREDRTLYISSQGRGHVFNKKLKIVGFDKPALLSDDTTSIEINPQLIVYLANYRLLMSISGGRVTDPDDSKQSAGQYRALAERILSGLATPQGVPTK